ncbi:hypothetical protein CR513_55269, partial [Mucuna pruriens]
MQQRPKLPKGTIPQYSLAHYRRVTWILKGATTNKLTPNWDRPFRVREEVGQGAFKLEQLDRRLVSCTWSTTTLRKYYS